MRLHNALLLLLALLLTPISQAQARWYKVIHIYDGDTVQIDDNRRVRIIGINTPEIAHEGRPAEPGGEAAKVFLERYFNRHGADVRLHFEKTRHDRYHRLLAHLESRDGSDPARTLLETGHAHVMLYPPNVGRSREQLQWESLAREKRLGIWALSRYQMHTVAEIGTSRGFYRLSCPISATHKRGKGWSLDCSDTLTLRIPARNSLYFRDSLPDPTALVGSTVALRGRVSRHKHHSTLWLDHPLQIEQISPAD